MTGKGIDGGDPRPDGVRLAKNVYRVPSRHNLRAQSVLRAITDEQHQILRIAEIVLQMVEDAACFAHARRADDDGCILEIVELYRMGDFADVRKVGHAKGIRFL